MSSIEWHNGCPDSEALLGGIVRAAPIGLGVVVERQLQWVNERFCRITGYDRGDLLGRDARMLYPGAEEHAYVGREKYRQISEEETGTVNTRFRRKDGSVVDILLSSTPLVPGDLSRGVVFTATDVSEHRNLENALQHERERLEVTLKSISDGVITTDVRGRVTLMNDAAETMTGWTDAAARGRLAEDICYFVDEKTGDQIFNPLKLLIELHGGEDQGLFATICSQTGAERSLQIRCSPIRKGPDDILGFVFVLRDLTEIRRVEAESIKNQKLEALGVLAGGIAHDFNNMLMSLVGHIGIAKSKAGENQHIADRLQRVEKVVMRARGLTQQLLTFSRGGSMVLRNVSPGCLVRETAAFALQGSNVDYSFAADDDLWSADIDEGQISQVISNLIINADQAMPEGGTIHVRCRNVVAGDAPGVESGETIRRAGPSVPAGQYVQVSVTDQGCGIPEKLLFTIFDPYFTTKKSGSGLGLAMAYAVVKRHGGQIDVESREGYGTTFQVYLPVSAAKEAALSPEIPGESSPNADTGTLLIMDDQEEIREVLFEMTGLLGYESVCVGDGAEAVERYRQQLENGDPFTAVIMDLTVPGAMGGREAIALIRELDPGVKAIVASGYFNDPVMARYWEHGFDGVIKKPFKIEKLGAALAGVLASR